MPTQVTQQQDGAQDPHLALQQEREVSEGAKKVTSISDAEEDLPHPIWELNWSYLGGSHVPLCCAVLFLLAAFFAAAGVGGGGVYVAVLMVLGAVEPYDAVPLSQAIVASSTLASLTVNARRWWAAGGADIDIDVVRLMVPAMLLGTLLGCVMNPYAPDLLILVALAGILPVLACISMRIWNKQRLEESAAKLEMRTGGEGEGETREGAPAASGTPAVGQALLLLKKGLEGEQSSRLQWQEVLLATALLVTVAIAGALRFHMDACRTDKVMGVVHSACSHPFLIALFSDRMDLWMRSAATFGTLQWMVILLPSVACLLTSTAYAQHLAVEKKWAVGRVAVSHSVGFLVGVMSGLVGLSGLVLSPFFLLSMDPLVAVATSSTCVLYTASAAALLYALVDRVIPALALVYGSVAFVGALCGTSMVHVIRQKMPSRKSAITLIVASAVLLSNLLVLAKVMNTLNSGKVAHFVHAGRR